MVYNSDENRKKYDALPVLEHRKVSSSVHSTQARKQPKLFPHRLFIIRNNFPFCKGCFSRIKRLSLAYFSSVPDDGSALEVRCFLFLLAVLLAASPMKSSPRCAVLFSPALSRFSGKGFFYLVILLPRVPRPGFYPREPVFLRRYPAVGWCCLSPFLR